MINTTTALSNLDYQGAVNRLRPVVIRTPLALSFTLSRRYHCEVYLKREDLQVVRSYTLRGAYNMMGSLSKEQLQKGVVCASAGNPAQGFAYSCKKLHAKVVVFMPIKRRSQTCSKQNCLEKITSKSNWLGIRLMIVLQLPRIYAAK